LSRWLLLSYKIPGEPTAQRVYVWRKLKRLGAHLLDGAVWVLPKTPHTLEDFQWLAAEIAELGGHANLWEARPAFPGQDEALVKLFEGHANESYRRMLTELEENDADLRALSWRYQQIRAKDYFGSALGARAREALLASRGGGDR